MTDNVIPMFGEVLHDIPVDEFLDMAKNAGLENAIVLGQTEEGSFYMGSNTGNFKELAYLMLRANNHMNRIENCFPTEDDGLFDGD